MLQNVLFFLRFAGASHPRRTSERGGERLTISYLPTYLHGIVSLRWPTAWPAPVRRIASCKSVISRICGNGQVAGAVRRCHAEVESPKTKQTYFNGVSALLPTLATYGGTVQAHCSQILVRLARTSLTASGLVCCGGPSSLLCQGLFSWASQVLGYAMRMRH